MLKDSLFNIISMTQQDNSIAASLSINKANEIFSGHFPGQPVLPGACMLQMLKEVLETALDKQLHLKKADQLKFLSLIDPRDEDVLQLAASFSNRDNMLIVNANISSNDKVCFKFRGSFVNRN